MGTHQSKPPVEPDTRAPDLRRPVCFACGSTKLNSIDDITDYHASTQRTYALDACRSCGSARLREVLSAAELQRLYPPTFYSYDTTERRSSLSALADRFRYNRHRFRPRFSRLLEIGSGCGEFLATIKNRGEVVGLERSTAAREKAKQLGVDVRVGDVADRSLFESESFDYAYLSHSLEHLDDPAAAILSLRHWLTRNGRIFIAVPNYAGLLPRLFRKSWYNLALPLHVSQFTRRGLCHLLERHAFVVDRVAYNSDPISIPMTIGFAAGLQVRSIDRSLQRLITAMSLLCVPLSRLLDRMAIGDCIEVHAHKKEG